MSDLKIGDKGASVSELQRQLKTTGFLKQNDTGEFDTKTREAVMAFQKVAGLPITGYADKETQYRLGVAASGGQAASAPGTDSSTAARPFWTTEKKVAAAGAVGLLLALMWS